MKKTILFLTAVMMMVFLLPTLSAASVSPSDITGNWWLTEIIRGNKSTDPAKEGGEVMMTLFESGIMTRISKSNGTSEAATGSWAIRGDRVEITLGTVQAFTLSGGKLIGSFSDGTTAVFSRKANAPGSEKQTSAAPAEAAGGWTLAAVSAGGREVSAKEAGNNLHITLYPDGTAILESDRYETPLNGTWTQQDASVVMQFNGMTATGLISGDEMTVTGTISARFVRDGGGIPEQELTGTWVLTEMNQGFIQVDPAVIGYDMKITLWTGGRAQIVSVSQQSSLDAAWSISGDRIRVTTDETGGEEFFTLEDGKLILTGGDTVMVFTREEESSGNRYLGTWKIDAVSLYGIRLDMNMALMLGEGTETGVLDMIREVSGLTVEISDAKAVFRSGSNTAEYTLSVSDHGLVLRNLKYEDGTEAVLEKDGDGNLTMKYPIGDTEATLYFIRTE